MAECLILGLAGTGKSSVIAELANRGRVAYDADLVPGLGGWFDVVGQPCTYSSDPAWRASHRFLWDMAALERLLEERDDKQVVYFAGLATNDRDAIPLFNNVVALDACIETICQRLKAPSRYTPYHFDCTDQYQALLAEAIPRFRKDMMNLGAVVINAEVSVEQVADDLIAVVEG